MSQTNNKSEIQKYILDSKYALLNYVRSDLTPVSRAIGSFAPDGDDLFFSTRQETSKVKEIEKNRRVSFYFEHDNQAPESWKSLLLIGDAEPVSVSSQNYEKAVERLGAKSPRFKERVDKGELDTTVLYRIRTSELQYLDRSISNSASRIILVR